ncbi:hypothetical protein HAX54_034119, partial [Datura stramonium]|nr:hypothetical protein [Datura stramonium]
HEYGKVIRGIKVRLIPRVSAILIRNPEATNGKQRPIDAANMITVRPVAHDRQIFENFSQ